MAEPARLLPRWHSVREVLRAAWEDHPEDLDQAAGMAMSILEAEPGLYREYAHPLIYAALRDELRNLRMATRRKVSMAAHDETGRGERLRQSVLSPYAWRLSNGKAAGDATYEDFVAEMEMYAGQISELAWRHRYMELLVKRTAKAKRKALRNVLTEEELIALQQQAQKGQE